MIALATSLGLHIGLLPTWGDKWNTKWGTGPEIFTPENARTYGEFLGRRYADSDLIWILGGDRPIETEAHRMIIRAMAEGLRAGDGGSHLMAFHTWGPHSSTEYVADETWVDLHMIQSGHLRNRENWRTDRGGLRPDAESSGDGCRTRLRGQPERHRRSPERLSRRL